MKIISNEGIQLIQHFESCRLKAYGSTSVAGTAGNTYSGVAGYCTLIVEAIKI